MKQLSIVWILAWSLIAVPAVAATLAANQTAGVVEAATAIAQKAEPCECGTENNPGALEVLARFGGLGRTVVFSDGDAVFQPRKIERSGIRRAVAASGGAAARRTVTGVDP